MPTRAGTATALGVLVDGDMLPDVPAQRAEQRVTSWLTLLEASMSDATLGEAVKIVASGEVELYGRVKPADVNKAAAIVRARRVREWLARHSLPVGKRSPWQQCAYLKGFTRAIGNGLDEIEADRHGRAAVNMLLDVAQSEPGTPPDELLARMEAALDGGHLPWAGALPAPRAPAQIGSAPLDEESGGPTGPDRARAAIRALAKNHTID